MSFAICFFYKISGFIDQGDQFTDNNAAFFPFKSGIIGYYFFTVVIAAFYLCNSSVFIIEYRNFGIDFEGNNASLLFCLSLDCSAGLCCRRPGLLPASASDEPSEERKC